MPLSYSNSIFNQAKAANWYGGLSTGTQPDSAWCCGEIDDQENVYIGSRNVFAKINNEPSIVWQKSLSDTSAIITGLVVDSSYNVYICYVTLLSGSYYVNIEKFNSSGTSVWAKQLTSAVNPLTTTATLGSEPNQYPRMSLGSSSTLFLSVHGKAIFKLDTDGTIVWQYSTAIPQSNSTPAVFYTTNTLLTTVTSDIRGNILACDPITLTKITDNGSTASVAWSKHHKHAIGGQINLGPVGGTGSAEYNVNSSTAIADNSNNVLWIVHRSFWSGGYGGLNLTLFTHRFNFNSAGAVGRTALAGVAISDTAGQFTCTATTLAAGDHIKIDGTITGTGSITSHTDGKIYKVSAVTGTSPSVTGFTLTQENTDALVTTAGNGTGLTYTPQNTFNTSDGILGAGYKLLAFDSINSFIYVTSFAQSVPFLREFGDNENICNIGRSITRRIAAGNTTYQPSHSPLTIKHSSNFRSGNSIATTQVYPGGCLKINGNNAVLISPSSNSSLSYPTNMIYKYNLTDLNNNIYYSSGTDVIYNNGSPQSGATGRISYIKVNTLNDNVNPDYTISTGGYSANIGINNTNQYTEISEQTYVGQSTTVSSASISTTSYTLSTISSLASTSSETFISKVFYYK